MLAQNNSYIDNTQRIDALVFFLLSSVLYFFSRSISLDEFDALNLAYGLRDFDLTLHQPHPPGAPLFIFFGKVLHAIGLSEKDSLQLLAAMGGGILVGACHFLIYAMYGRMVAFWYALILMLLPGLWMTSGKAMTDSLSTGLLMLTTVFLFMALKLPEAQRRYCLIATVLAAATIGIRPPLAPLVLIILVGSLLLQAGWRTYRDMLIVFTIACLLWLVPTVVTQANLISNQNGWFNYLAQMEDFRRESSMVASWHYDFSQSSLHYFLKRFVMHLGGTFYFGMGFSVWYPEVANKFLASLATRHTPWNASIAEWSVGGTIFFGFFVYGWYLMLTQLRHIRAIKRIELVGLAWFFIVFVFLFLTVPPLMRYYLPLYPMLLVPAVMFIHKHKRGTLMLGVMTLSLLASTLPLAIDQATEYAPPVRFVQAVQKHQKENRFKSENVRLLVNANVRRHLSWYAPELRLIGVDDADKDWWEHPDDVIVYSNLQPDQVKHSEMLDFEPIAEHGRSLRVWMRHNSVNLYVLEKKPDLSAARVTVE